MRGLFFWTGAAAVVVGGSSNYAVNRIATGSDNSGSGIAVVYPALAFINNNSIWFVLGGLLLILVSIFL